MERKKNGRTDFNIRGKEGIVERREGMEGWKGGEKKGKGERGEEDKAGGLMGRKGRR